MVTKHHRIGVAPQGASRISAVLKREVPFAICAAAACAVSVYVASGATALCGALLALLMAAIAYRDAQDFIIPDQYSAAAFVLGLLAAIFVADNDAAWAIGMALARAATLASAFLALRAAYHRFRGRHGLGLGDVKLAGVAGAWLDWTMLPVAVEIAAVSALLIVLVEQLVVQRALKATSRLPFGLFFAPSIWIAWFVQTALPWP